MDSIALIVNPEEGELVLGIGSEVDAANVLIVRVRKDVAEDVAIGTLIGSGNVLVQKRLRDRIEDCDGKGATIVCSASCPRGAGGRAVGETGDVGERAGDGCIRELVAEHAAGDVVGEVTGTLRRGEDGGGSSTAGVGYALTETLVRTKEEELVLEDRTSERGTKEVLMVGRDQLVLGSGLRCRNIGEVVAGVEEGIAVELEDVAVELVGTGLDGRVDDRT